MKTMATSHSNSPLQKKVAKFTVALEACYMFCSGVGEDLSGI